MKAMDLRDIKPQDCEITVFGETLTMRKFTGHDQVWLQESFTEDEQRTLFSDKMSDATMSRIAFHQLAIEDQKKYGKFVVDFVDEDTNEVTQKTWLGWKAFHARLSGLPDKVELFRGLMSNIGLSTPVLKEMFDDEEIKVLLEKKSPTKKKKKKRTGQK